LARTRRVAEAVLRRSFTDMRGAESIKELLHAK